MDEYLSDQRLQGGDVNVCSSHTFNLFNVFFHRGRSVWAILPRGIIGSAPTHAPGTER
jgi:hypothetical protein